MLSLLAFDTSTERMHLAVCKGRARWCVSLPGGAQTSAGLLPGVQGLLDQAGLRLTDLDAIAFGQGPGAFTGLRTACAVAQGLALGADRPVLPVDTLAVLAQAARDARPGLDGVWAVLDARMQQVYAAPYAWTPAGWQPMQAAAAYDPPDLPDDGRVLAGPAHDTYAGRWRDAVSARWLHVDLTPQALMDVAEQSWSQGRAVDPALAAPVYVRDKVAYTTDERAQQAALKRAVTP